MAESADLAGDGASRENLKRLERSGAHEVNTSCKAMAVTERILTDHGVAFIDDGKGRVGIRMTSWDFAEPSPPPDFPKPTPVETAAFSEPIEDEEDRR